MQKDKIWLTFNFRIVMYHVKDEEQIKFSVCLLPFSSEYFTFLRTT